MLDAEDRKADLMALTTAQLQDQIKAGATADYMWDELAHRFPELLLLRRLAAAAFRAEQMAGLHDDESLLADESSTPGGAELDRQVGQLQRRMLDHPEGGYYDTAALAIRMGIQPDSVTKNVARGALPAPDLTVSGRPAWHWLTVEACEQTRRPPGRPRRQGHDPDKNYRAHSTGGA